MKMSKNVIGEYAHDFFLSILKEISRLFLFYLIISKGSVKRISEEIVKITLKEFFF